MKIAEAQELIYTKVNEPDPHWPERPELVILEDATIDKEWGWVFFYQSSAYLKSRAFADRIAGNAPYIVDRHTGKVTATGTAFPIEHYIEEYEKQYEPDT